MKKLNLLKPKVKSVYLEEGKGEEVKYLYIPEKIDKNVLEKDVKAGAVQFAECLEFAKKKPTRVVLIDCSNEEEGLMAATYLAGIYNIQDDVYDDWFEYASEEDMPWRAEAEAKELSYDDMNEIFGADTDYEQEDDYDDGMEVEAWEEHPQRMPILTLGELTRYTTEENYTPFPGQNGFSLGNNNVRSKEPYWLTARHEPVCIVSKESRGFGFGLGCDGEGLVRELKRFDGNRHVFVVLVQEKHSKLFGYGDDDDTPVMSLQDEKICEVVLEYTAGLLKVDCKDEERKLYYQLLFENWAREFGKKLEPRFPKAAIVEQIVSMRNENKSERIEKVYRYILSQEGVGDVLTKEDFSVLKRFRVLGVSAAKKEEAKSIQKLHSQLVGMESVKRQIQSIVDVMKFNKKRMQMGLGNGGYHNVHLLIGAPGTAKTTVAQLLGNIMCEQKLLSDNRFISINGADLKGMYVGHSAPKTKSYFDNYDIIFIDEAYSVVSDHDMDSFSQEAIAQLIIELEKHGMDKLVMFAGYGGTKVNERDNKMKCFLDANPGIRSRINSTIYFESYTPEEMVEIVHCQAHNQKYRLTHEGDDMIKAFFKERVKAPDFGNGREARSLLENITLHAATRTMQMPDNKVTKKALQQLTLPDVKAALKQQSETYVLQRGQVSQRCGFN